MNLKKIVKITKYIGASSMLLLLSSILGQKNSIDYSPINTALADISGGVGGDGACSDSGSDASASDDGGGGVDGASDSGAGDGSCSA